MGPCSHVLILSDRELLLLNLCDGTCRTDGGGESGGENKLLFNIPHCCETNCYKLVFFHFMGLQRGPCGASPRARDSSRRREGHSALMNKEARGISCQPLSGSVPSPTGWRRSGQGRWNSEAWTRGSNLWVMLLTSH